MGVMLSFIVPVYKTPEHLLRQALESILKPSKIDLELICIDDSPGERSSEILREFAQRDRRVRVLTNDHNRGVSYSRNRGIEAARGEFITFQDADDLAILEGYEALLNFAQGHELNVVRGRGVKPFREKEWLGVPYQEKIYYTSALEKGNEDKIGVFLGWLDWAIHGGIYRRIALLDIRFTSTIRHHEDSLFNARMITSIDRVGIINVIVYQRFFHDESLSMKPPSAQTYLEFALAARAIARVIRDYARSRCHSTKIVQYYSRVILTILFTDRRVRRLIQSYRYRKAFAAGVCSVKKDIYEYVSPMMRIGLRCATFYPLALFWRGGLLWNFVKLCMKLDRNKIV